MKIKKYDTDLCDDTMTFDECEQTVLRNAVDRIKDLEGRKIVNSEQVQKILKILEDFLRRKKLICYGGYSIHVLLPKFAKLYNQEAEIPDYDVYSKDPLSDAKELADTYYKAGYSDTEARAGVHHGTYKVYCLQIPIADITFLHPEIFNEMKKEAVEKSGILFSPPNFLRMNMYLELSRPLGDVSRWEKVNDRLNKLNKYYPLKTPMNCAAIDFQRTMASYKNESEKIYFLVRDELITQEVVFFGGYASSLYAKYMPEKQRRILQKAPDFDVITEDPDTTAMVIKQRLETEGFKKVRIIPHDAIGEILPRHLEIKIGLETLCFLFEPIACHSYNKITINGNEVKIATIDTMLSFYFAFYYTKRPYFNKDRILCMAKFLFELEQKNRLAQRGLLKRFSIDCYGTQTTLEKIRSEKAARFQELKDKRDSKEYESWFLRYNPALKNENTKTRKNRKSRTNLSEKKGRKHSIKLPFGVELI